uniref:Uncharacterized protein n=1 Tax=Rhizophora mucronata TaxID=61149 RepID=A0A2P2NQK4_RHIMU
MTCFFNRTSNDLNNSRL